MYALHLVDDEVVCVQAFCPHMEGPLFEGTRSGSKLVCPWHEWMYDLSSCERGDSGEGERACLARLSVVDRGEVGEIVVRGPNVMQGYWNKPEATAETIVDGWLRSGDIGYLDEEGFIFVQDRAKDMVLRAGENIYCAEVESVLFDHDDVAECAAFGVEDARLGEEVGVAVTLRKDSPLTAEGLRAHCEGRLARHKIPRYLWLGFEPLPKNANGKFLKRQLRDDLDPNDAG